MLIHHIAHQTASTEKPSVFKSNSSMALGQLWSQLELQPQRKWAEDF